MAGLVLSSLCVAICSAVGLTLAGASGLETMTGYVLGGNIGLMLAAAVHFVTEDS